jgi:hypothetical protein
MMKDSLVRDLEHAKERLRAGDARRASVFAKRCVERRRETDDPRLLLDLAETCGALRLIEDQERVYRTILEFQLDEAWRSDLIWRFNSFLVDHHSSNAQAMREAIAWCDQALGLPTNASGPERANFLSFRAERYLDLLRSGEASAAKQAAEGFELYIEWLDRGQDVPDHYRRDNMRATAQVGLAEALVGLGQEDRAAELLVAAISVLEGNAVGAWATRHAYDLLLSIQET